MTSFSLDRSAVSRLRGRLGLDGLPSRPIADDAGAGPAELPGWFDGDDWRSRAASFRTRLLAPVERRFEAEVRKAVERHDTDLSLQVEQLRSELVRTRTAHEAELAALNEQIRSRA